MKHFQGDEAVSYAHDLQSKALPQRSRLIKDLTGKIAENVNGKVGGKTVGNDVEEVGREGDFTGDWGKKAAKHGVLNWAYPKSWNGDCKYSTRATKVLLNLRYHPP